MAPTFPSVVPAKVCRACSPEAKQLLIAQTQIDASRAVLASDADDDLQSYDLVWLLHLVGDVHQPLHATTRVSSTATQGDNGGNDESVCPSSPTVCSERLHTFWDGALGANVEVKDVVAIAEALPGADSTAAHNLETSDWIRHQGSDARGFCLRRFNGQEKTAAIQWLSLV